MTTDQEAKRKEALELLELMRGWILGYKPLAQVDDVHTAYNRIKKALTQSANAEPEWLDIESAPMDGTNIMLWWPSQFHCPLTGHWADKFAPWIGWKVSGWSHSKFKTEPTHWRPLPTPPVQALTKDKEG